MAQVGTIEARIQARTAEFESGIQKATASLRSFEERTQKTADRLRDFGATADQVAKRASLALAALVAAMGNAVRLASQQREAELRLAAAIRGTGRAIDVDKIRAYAAELQNLTTYGDEATIEAAALLTTFNLTENAIVALLPRLQNLSAMYKMDLSQAALQVGRALTQGAGALSRYGITMTEAEKQAYNLATQTEKVAMLLEIFDRNTGDAAQTLAGTGVGAFTQFKNAVGDLNEAIGFLLEQRVADFFQKATRRVQRLTTWFQNLDQNTRDQIVTWAGWTAGILAAVAGISMLVSVLAKLGSALALTARAIAAHPAVFLGAVAVGLALSIDQVREKLMDLAKSIPGIGGAIEDMSEEWAKLTGDLPDVDPSSVNQWMQDAMAGLRAEMAAEGALSGEEWAKAFAEAAAGLPGLLGLPGEEFRSPFMGSSAGNIATWIERSPEFLGIRDATEEQLNAALELVRGFANSLQSELNVGRAVAAVTGQPFDEIGTKLEATRSLLHALVEEVGVPISSPFAQQLLQWIETLNAQLPQAVEQLTLVEQLMGFRAGTIEADLGARLQALQKQAEGTDIILAKAAQSQIDAAVSAFEEAFLRTADTGQAAAAALVALIGIEPNFRMLDSQLTDAADYVERTRTELERFADALRSAGSSAAGDLADTLLSLQETALGGDPILAEAAQRRIDAAVAAFHDAFYETGDAAQAATAALVALAGTAPNFRMLDSQLTDTADYVEALGDAANLSMKSQRAWALRMQGQADAWRESLSWQERFTMGLREAGRAASDFASRLLDRFPAAQAAVDAYRHARAPMVEGGLGMGLAGGLGAGAAALIAHSQTFAQLMGVINPILQALSDALGSLLEPLLPLAVVIGQVLAPVFQMIGVILSSLLLPVLSLLFEPLKWVGIGLLYLAKAVSWVANGIISIVNLVIRAYNSLLGWLTGRMKEIKHIDLGSFDDAIKDLTDLTWDQAMATAKLADETERATEALRNVPQGFKIALRRFQVQDPIPMAEGGIVTSPTIALIGEAGPEAVVPLGGDGFGTGVVHVEIHGSIYGVDDLKGVIRQAVAEGNRRTRMATYGLARG